MRVTRNPFSSRIAAGIKAAPASAPAAAKSLADLLLRLVKCVDEFDPIFQQHVRLRLESMTHHVEEFMRQELSFKYTETWRTVYADILSQCQGLVEQSPGGIPHVVLAARVPSQGVVSKRG
jgi:hypothetical protein